MGGILTTAKTSWNYDYTDDVHGQFVCGESAMQGRRHNMEDKTCVKIGIEIDDTYNVKTASNVAHYFGVFDGHSGIVTSEKVSTNLFRDIIASETRRMKTNEGSYPFGDNTSIERAFLQLDKHLKNNLERGDESGSTGVVLILNPIKGGYNMICANVGDSRCVFYNEGKITPLSSDHKPSDEEESRRIKNVGFGIDIETNRIGGRLNLSRAFGDFEYKGTEKLGQRDQAVIALPDIHRETVFLKHGTYLLSLGEECDDESDSDEEEDDSDEEEEEEEDDSDEEEEEEEDKDIVFPNGYVYHVGGKKKEDDEDNDDDSNPDEGIEINGFVYNFVENRKKKTVMKEKVMKSKYKFAILACDGIWDAMTNEQVCNFIVRGLKERENGTYIENHLKRLKLLYEIPDGESDGEKNKNKKDLNFEEDVKPRILRTEKKYLSLIVEELLDTAAIAHKSSDNISAILVVFKTT
ncbi:MAG: PP2C family serine/threonine-protein phosphatase [Promethearchaeota archaeon]